MLPNARMLVTIGVASLVAFFLTAAAASDPRPPRKVACLAMSGDIISVPLTAAGLVGVVELKESPVASLLITKRHRLMAIVRRPPSRFLGPTQMGRRRPSFFLTAPW